jgi:hypothetical protein
MTEIGHDIEWNPRLEHYFAGTGEKANSLSWLHKKSEARYSRLRNYTDLPVIVLGVLNGATSIGSASLFGDDKMASIGVGIVALGAALLNTISSYFGWARRAEGHRIASLQYSKLYRFLCVQMSLPRHERMTPSDLLRHTKESYDRLQETSPMIPQEVIDDFKSRFSGEKYMNISKPEEVNTLEVIEVYPEVTEPPALSAKPASSSEASSDAGIHHVPSAVGFDLVAAAKETKDK